MNINFIRKVIREFDRYYITEVTSEREIFGVISKDGKILASKEGESKYVPSPLECIIDMNISSIKSIYATFHTHPEEVIPTSSCSDRRFFSCLLLEEKWAKSWKSNEPFANIITQKLHIHFIFSSRYVLVWENGKEEWFDYQGNVLKNFDALWEKLEPTRINDRALLHLWN
jgi:hypothetical protein